MGRPKGKNGGAQDYTIGYGRPPAHSRFKPGQSGNPKGRPRGSRNVETLLREELDRPITIVEGGKRKTLPTKVVLIKRLIERGIRGDLRAIDRIFVIDGSSPPSGLTAGWSVSPEQSRALLNDYIERQIEARQRDTTADPATDAPVEDDPDDGRS